MAHVVPNFTFPKGVTLLLSDFKRRVEKEMTHELIYTKQMESLGENGFVEKPGHKRCNLRIIWCMSCKFHENQPATASTRVY